jgi:nicotinic acid mononucleotide adenylyltransferase
MNNLSLSITKLLNNLQNLNSKQQPVVLSTQGSFNPIHNQHVKMFEVAKKEIEKDPNKKVVAGYISPLPDSEYMRKKLGNEAAEFKVRAEMVRLALEDSS